MKRVAISISALAFLLSTAFGAQIPNGGFEGDAPNYFSSGGTSTTAVASWATDEWRTGGHSVKIVKSAADGDAYWASEDLLRYWSVGAGVNVAMEVGAWVKLSGVNINPANATEEIQLIFNFFDAFGQDLLGEALVLAVPQTAAATGWVEVKNAVLISFPVRTDDITVKVNMAANATGTVWVDDFFIRAPSGGWAGDFFGPNVDTPSGWFYWWPNFSVGQAVWDTIATWTEPVFAGQDTSVSRTADASLKLVKDSTGYEIVVNSEITDFDNTGHALKFAAWVKTALPVGMATLANNDGTAAVGFTVTWHDGTGGADGWGEVGGNDYRFTLASDTTDWTEYTWTVTPPVDATQYSLRARNWHNFLGTTWWDDFSMEPQTASTNLLADDVSGFEGTEPNYFNTDGTSSTATMSWATDQWRTGGHSVKIVKPNADGDAAWVSEDLLRYWSAGAGANVSMEVGAWVKLDGVNINPADDSAQVQLMFTFLDENGNDLAGGPLTLQVPQTAAATGWVEVKNSQLVSFPVRVDDILVKARMADKATGTVWVDDFFIRAPSGGWAGDFFGPNVDTPDGWFYWWPNFSVGQAVWDTLAAWTEPVFAGQDTSVAHTGDASLKLVKDSTGYEIVVNSDFRPFINDGKALEFSAWVKTDLPTGMAALADTDGTAAIGFTVTWHDDTGGSDGWGEVGGSDYRFSLAGDVTDWTQYTVQLSPIEGATQFSLRARNWHNFVGTTWWDDFQVIKTNTTLEIGDRIASIPKAFRLDRVYPNPFNPSVTIQFDVPASGPMDVRIYDILGREVASLLDKVMSPGTHRIVWNARAKNGISLPTGIYLVRAQFGDQKAQVQKITYLK